MRSACITTRAVDSSRDSSDARRSDARRLRQRPPGLDRRADEREADRWRQHAIGLASPPPRRAIPADLSGNTGSNGVRRLARTPCVTSGVAVLMASHVPRHLRIPPEVNHYLQNEGWGKVRLLADEEELQAGIRVFWAGVHHRSSMAVAIDTDKGTVIITDAFFKYGNIESGRYLGVMESMIEADATWARIRKEADLFASIYDPEVFARHPGGILA